MRHSQIRVEVISPEEAAEGTAEFWCGAELMAITEIYEGQLHLRVEARSDGQPWMIDTTSLAAGLVEAATLLGTV